MDLPAYLRSIDETLAPKAPVATAVPTPAPSSTPSAMPSAAPSASKPAFTFETAPLMQFPADVKVNSEIVSKQNKLKFMLVSTHAQQFTGYSKVSFGILEQLAKLSWLELTHFGFQRHPQTPADFRRYPSNVNVIDAASLENPPQQGFGYQALVDTIRKKQPHVVMVYNDMAVVTRFLEEIRKSGMQRNFKLWVYCDQVYDCQLQGMIDLLNRDADRVFAFTSFWKKCLKDQGVNRPIDLILHGFDKQLYFTLPREMVRKQMGIPNDAFVYLNLNRNQPRKRYDLLIMAFVELLVKNPTKPIFLMCVCDKGEKGGWWLFEIFQRELKMRGVAVEMFANRLMISSQDMQFRDEEINLFYNVADVGISTADGEGWGLCSFEQMGVGIPQVVPDIGGFKEFCRPNNSVMVKPKHRYYLPMVYSPVGGEAEACDPHDVCLGMEEYLFDSKKLAAHGAAAKEMVLSYTWEKATEQFVKRLQETKKELAEEGDL